jgi:CBS domain-containing protein/gamma-glutamylcysteine synthetase
MGEQRVSIVQDKEQMQKFVRYLLNDVRSLEYMLENDWFESDIIRIGAEQEMALVNRKTFKPMPIAMEVLEKLKDHPWVESELAKFNLEINLKPQTFKGSCLRDMEKETLDHLHIIRETLKDFNADLFLTGILPTLRKFDLELHNLTPKKRYRALMDAINQQLISQDHYELRLTGIDELLIKHGSPLLEACNTSFQVHLQVSPDQFVKMYNIAQVLAAPSIAISANSPLVFGRRLWHESRIALFQQALDTRGTTEHLRERSPRVQFGKNWLQDSILDIYKDDIARYRVLLAGDVEEDSLQMIKEGKTPKLRALQVHNSTVYRWNRPCYGISGNGKPHLRIENRVFPAGPTVVDEIANAAFWLGAMIGMADRVEDIRDHMSFDDASDNFGKAARFGIDSKFTWYKDQKVSAKDLILYELLPMAKEGLKKQKVRDEDITRYMDIIQERAERHQTGARWALRAFSDMKSTVSIDEAISVLMASTAKNQQKEIPIHEWELPKLGDLEEYSPSSLKVEEFMETELFTVQKNDIIDLVAEMMNWRKIRYMPVENSKGHLVGLITSRLLMRHYSNKVVQKKNGGNILVKDIMIKSPISIGPSASIVEALKIMRTQKIGCLPVVKDKELIGLITEMDFLRISGRLIERLEGGDQ